MRKITELEDTSKQTKANYDQQKENCNNLFQTIISVSSSLKQVYLTKLSSQFAESLEQYQQLHCQLQNVEEQLRQFRQDIDKNQDNIVKYIDMKPFDDIMTKYEKKVEDLTGVIPSIELPSSFVMKYVDDSVIKQQMSQLCYNLYFKNDSQNLKNELEDIFQSTASLSVPRCSSIKKNQSPMNVPFNPLYNSKRESGQTSPDQIQKFDSKSQERQVKFSENLNDLIKKSPIKTKYFNQDESNRTPIHSKQQSNCSLSKYNNSQQKKSFNLIDPQQKLKSTTPNSQAVLLSPQQYYEKKQSTANNSEALKDNIFNEIGSADSQSVYSQVLKQKKNSSQGKFLMYNKENSITTGPDQPSLAKSRTTYLTVKK